MPESLSISSILPISSRLPRVTVLGAGPTGLAAAHRLRSNAQATVTVLEQSSEVGGNAGTFQLEGVWCDHGSHRLHPSVGRQALDDIKTLLGEDLLWRPRHGRILLQGRWIHFPLEPVDLVTQLPKRFAAKLLLDAVRTARPRRELDERNFKTALEASLGPSLSEAFYFPYMRKLWGLEPEQLSATLAQRRISAGSISKILSRIRKQLTGAGGAGGSGFFYPRYGFGQISERLRQAAERRGAQIELEARVNGVEHEGERIIAVHYEKGGRSQRLEAEAFWSTLPITALLRSMKPAPPTHVLEAARGLRFRGLILIYLVLATDRFTEYDAHYFPEPLVPISRMSEPKNYSASSEPRGTTVLCAELPAEPGQPIWGLSDDELGRRYCEWLARVGLPVKVGVVRTVVRRLPYVYPVYDLGFERKLETIDEWLLGFSNLVSLGRQGLFALDNTHHAMAMAYAACDCLNEAGGFDWSKWAAHRREFESHVVED
jgi:protoporphyrinogen oxidase